MTSTTADRNENDSRTTQPSSRCIACTCGGQCSLLAITTEAPVPEIKAFAIKTW